MPSEKMFMHVVPHLISVALAKEIVILTQIALVPWYVAKIIVNGPSHLMQIVVNQVKSWYSSSNNHSFIIFSFLSECTEDSDCISFANKAVCDTQNNVCVGKLQSSINWNNALCHESTIQ